MSNVLLYLSVLDINIGYCFFISGFVLMASAILTYYMLTMLISTK